MANRLQLNPQETELMWCSSTRRQHQVPLGPVSISNSSVPTVSSVRDLGVHINSDVSLSTHVTATVRTCLPYFDKCVLCVDHWLVMLSSLWYVHLSSARLITVLASWLESQRSSSVDFSQFSMLLLVRRTYTGWRRRKESDSAYVCWLIAAFTVLHLHNYIAESLQLAYRIEGRRRLRSTDAMDLFVPATRCSTLSDRSFSVAAARAWNAFTVIRQTISFTICFPSPPQNWTVSSVIPCMNFFLCHICFRFCNCFVKCPQQWHC